MAGRNSPLQRERGQPFSLSFLLYTLTLHAAMAQTQLCVRAQVRRGRVPSKQEHSRPYTVATTKTTPML